MHDYYIIRNITSPTTLSRLGDGAMIQKVASLWIVDDGLGDIDPSLRKAVEHNLDHSVD